MQILLQTIIETTNPHAKVLILALSPLERLVSLRKLRNFPTTLSILPLTSHPLMSMIPTMMTMTLNQSCLSSFGWHHSSVVAVTQVKL